MYLSRRLPVPWIMPVLTIVLALAWAVSAALFNTASKQSLDSTALPAKPKANPPSLAPSTLILKTALPAPSKTIKIAEPSVMPSPEPIQHYIQKGDTAPQNKPASADNLNNHHNLRVATASEIPFPLYPNGHRYRIGGKDGMKIALFETTDDFTTVEKFYDRQAEANGLARKPMTQDYVQYLQPPQAIPERVDPEPLDANAGTQTTDNSEWQQTLRPGVVIHEFQNASEATKLGATAGSRTNIIISFR